MLCQIKDGISLPEAEGKDPRQIEGPIVDHTVSQWTIEAVGLTGLGGGELLINYFSLERRLI